MKWDGFVKMPGICFTDKPHVVSMLKQRLGYSFFHNVVSVSYSAESPKSLSIAPPFWSAIEELNHLQRINFEGCQIDVRDLSRHVQRPSTLQMLGLAKCNVRDEELAALCRFRSLTWLNLADTAIGDEGMKSIGKLHDLKLLCLWNTAITDDGLGHLEPLEQLVWLSLDGTCVSFESTWNIGRWRCLEVLDLGGTQIGDDGLLQLVKLPRLDRLDVRDTRVTPAGAAKFMHERPDVYVCPYSPSPFKKIQ